MILRFLPTTWVAIAPNVADHLWQSTLFAITVALLTLALRKNQARARYWLWLAASVKFLIPFSLLAGVGSHLAWSHGSASAQSGLYSAVEEVSLPFTQPTMLLFAPAASSAGHLNFMHLLPALLAALWLCGFRSRSLRMVRALAADFPSRAESCAFAGGTRSESAAPHGADWWDTKADQAGVVA